MTSISDDFMRQMLATTRVYSLVLLKAGPNRNRPDIQSLIWEHGRRNFELRADGKLAIVGPTLDGGAIAGMGIFATDEAETKRLMDADPAVAAGVFVYEIHPMKSFPGDRLPQ